MSVAIVMNLFYTGLGIARSLGERGISVIGLSAHRESYGRFTRYAKVRCCPDSREQPEALLEFLLALANGLPERGIIFPTRDDDVVFLDRFREQLSPRFVLCIPETTALNACLDKWETCRYAQQAEIAVPRTWRIESKDDLLRIQGELVFPCVLKPLSAYHWRKGRNWQAVGGRKAIPVFSPDELFTAYATIGHAESRALVQEFISGDDDCLLIAACYVDRRSQGISGFTAQKLLQVPKEVGTGCIVQTVDRPDLLHAAARFLGVIHFTGIAEVEFKLDRASGEYKLIEVNPRPWDQHRLGHASGIDLIHAAFCDLAGLPVPPAAHKPGRRKWIADDVCMNLFGRSLLGKPPGLGCLLRLIRGRRVYAIWSAADPLPFCALLTLRLGPEFLAAFLRYLWGAVRRLRSFRAVAQETPVL